MAEHYALSTFGLTTENLVCLVYSPFVGGCRHLHRYLAAEQPDLVGRETEIVRMLAGNEAGDPALAARLERISGLSITDLRQIYASPVWSPFGAASDDKQLLPLITTSDPHQKLIHVRDGESDDPVLDRVSGR
jgi:hypothetical protein